MSSEHRSQPEHAIDLSRVPHGPGQSPDLETKRRRAWDRLDDEQRSHVVKVYDTPWDDWALPCLEAGGAYERVLCVLGMTAAELTPEEIAYLLIARWYRNMDLPSIRSRLARMVQVGEARWLRGGRYRVTTAGVERLRQIEQRWLQERQRQVSPGGTTPRQARPRPQGRRR